MSEDLTKPQLTIEIPIKEEIQLNTITEPNNITLEQKEVSFEDQHEQIIKQAIVNLFKNKDRLKVATALDIISMIMEIAEQIFLNDAIAKKNLVLSIIERIAKGLDGIEGTSDDIISVETMNSIRILLQNNLIEGIINGLIKASKQLFNFNKTHKICTKPRWCCF